MRFPVAKSKTALEWLAICQNKVEPKEEGNIIDYMLRLFMTIETLGLAIPAYNYAKGAEIPDLGKSIPILLATGVASTLAVSGLAASMAGFRFSDLYLHNETLTRVMTPFERLGAKRVKSIDDMTEMPRKGIIFANGVHLDSPSLADAGTYDGNLMLDGTFQGSPLHMVLIADYQEAVSSKRRVAFLNSLSDPAYVLGEVNNGRVMIIRWGQAFPDPSAYLAYRLYSAEQQRPKAEPLHFQRRTTGHVCYRSTNR